MDLVDQRLPGALFDDAEHQPMRLRAGPRGELLELEHAGLIHGERSRVDKLRLRGPERRSGRRSLRVPVELEAQADTGTACDGRLQQQLAFEKVERRRTLLDHRPAGARQVNRRIAVVPARAKAGLALGHGPVAWRTATA